MARARVGASRPLVELAELLHHVSTLSFLRLTAAFVQVALLERPRLGCGVLRRVFLEWISVRLGREYRGTSTRCLVLSLLRLSASDKILKSAVCASTSITTRRRRSRRTRSMLSLQPR